MDEERKILIDAIATGDVKRIKAIQGRLPFFLVIYHGDEYSFSLSYEEGKGNREQRTGKGDWEQSLTSEEKELLNFDYGTDEIRGFIVTIK
jgi:hypothetical protein